MVQECTRHEREAVVPEGSEDAAVGEAATAAAMPINLHVTRYNSLARGFHRSAPESDFWLAQQGEVAHPLTRYSLVNRARPPAIKSIVRPEVGVERGHTSSAPLAASLCTQ